MVNYIKIYAEDFDRDVWTDYCDACNVPYSATEITISFTDDKIDYVDGEEEDQKGDISNHESLRALFFYAHKQWI